MAVIVMETVLMHLFHAKSRHNANFKLRNKKKIIKSVNKFLNTNLDNFSHGDNVEKIFKKLSVQELQDFSTDIIFNLIRSKKVSPEDMLYGKYYLMAIDMTQTQKFKTNILNGKKMKGLTFQTNNGITFYSRKVVEAKLLLPNKMSLPVMTEFLTNEDYDENDKFSKQDCELKAAYRLIDKLKKKFPRLQICLLLDGLYPNQTIFQKCLEYNWKYIITFKEDKIPSLYRRFEDLKRVHYYGEKKKIINAVTNQRFKFISNDLKYMDYKINIVEMKEYQIGKGKTYYNVFITNIEITQDNVYIIGKAGRLRWKIEHSFNKQKNLLFSLTHIFSKDENASQCYHITLQIADLIFQFMAYSFTVNGDNVLYDFFGSLIEFLSEIYISFRSDIADFSKYFFRKQLILIEPDR